MQEWTRLNTFECGECGGALIPAFHLTMHERWHNERHRLPMNIPDRARVTITPQYGIEFSDESADEDTYDDLHGAREAMQAYAEAEDGEDITGMRMMSRTVTTIVGPWEPVS